MLDLDDMMRRGFDEFGRYVNPMIAERVRVASEPFRLVRAEGGRMIDVTGRAFEDFHGTQAFGHRHPAITRAILQYLETDLPSWYPSRLNPFAGRLARRLCERTGYERASFAFSGSDGVEAAIKMARAATGRARVLGLEHAYHGCGMGAMALQPPGAFRDPFGPHVPGLETLPFGDIGALEHALAAGDVAAVIVEPIQGEGGIRPLPDAYLGALGTLAPEHGALVIADEVQTGMGRTGATLLRSQRWPRPPDMAILAKHLGGGLVPISALLTRAPIWDRAYGRDIEDGEAHNATMSSNALAAIAALAALDVLDDALLERVHTLGADLRRELTERLTGSALFHEVRGEGFLTGIELVPIDHPWLSLEHFGMRSLVAKGRASIAPLLCYRLYARGYYCFTAGHDWRVVRIQPRFDIDPSTLVEFAKACREELDYLESLT